MSDQNRRRLEVEAVEGDVQVGTKPQRPDGSWVLGPSVDQGATPGLWPHWCVSRCRVDERAAGGGLMGGGRVSLGRYVLQVQSIQADISKRKKQTRDERRCVSQREKEASDRVTSDGGRDGRFASVEREGEERRDSDPVSKSGREGSQEMGGIRHGGIWPSTALTIRTL